MTPTHHVPARPGLWRRLGWTLHQLWWDADDARRLLDREALTRLEGRIANGEAHHGGELRLCIEASLPRALLWRHLRHGTPRHELARERALAVFAELRVWDTELNNGVLIHLQLADHRIEIVADRGLARRLTPDQWQPVLAAMADALRGGQAEAALALGIDAVHGVLTTHFPRAPGAPARDNQLPDAPVLR